MSAQMKLDLSNTPQVLVLPTGMFGYQQIVLAFASNPSSGTVTIEVLPIGKSQWLALSKAINLPAASAPYFIRSILGISQVRVTFSGVIGGVDAYLWAIQDDLPAGLFEGTAAITVQPYTEANVKNGVQYNLRAVWPIGDTIASLATKKLWFKTTTKPVLVKLRELQYIAEELRLQLFTGPTGVTGGTALDVHNYNGVAPVAATTQAKKNVTTVTDGTEFDKADPEYFFGSQAGGQRNVATALVGRERVLPANAEFLVVITNTGAGDARVQYFLDFYEGGTDLPL